MRPTTAYDNVFDFNALLHPSTVSDEVGTLLGNTNAPAIMIGERAADMIWEDGPHTISRHFVHGVERRVLKGVEVTQRPS